MSIAEPDYGGTGCILFPKHVCSYLHPAHTGFHFLLKGSPFTTSTGGFRLLDKAENQQMATTTAASSSIP